MDDVTKEEDILAVATGLSEDLSNITSNAAEQETVEEAEVESDVQPEASESEVEEDVVTDSEVSEEESEGEADPVAEEVQQQEEAEESSADDSEEADVQSVDSENAGEPEEASAEAPVAEEDEVQEAAAEDSDLTTNESSDEQDLEQLKAQAALLEEQVSSLKDENAKLRGALHMTLVERVVDTKIALGIEDSDDREALIGEHSSRTASSLADSLRDLAKASPVVAASGNMPVVMSEAEVIAEGNVVTLDSEEVEEEQLSPEQEFEQLFVDALMGRRKL